MTYTGFKTPFVGWFVFFVVVVSLLWGLEYVIVRDGEAKKTLWSGVCTPAASQFYLDGRIIMAKIKCGDAPVFDLDVPKLAMLALNAAPGKLICTHTEGIFTGDRKWDCEAK